MLMHRYITVIVLAVLANLQLSHSFAQERGERERTFIRALETFDNAKESDDYRKAAQEWESLLSDNFENGAVYYNIGNAYMRAGDAGRAIAAYRKAKLLRPRDQYLDANLRQAISVAPGRLPEAAKPWWKNIFFWSNLLSYPEKLEASFAFWAAGALFAAIALLLRKNGVYWASGIAIVAAVLLTVDATLAYTDVTYTHRAVVVKETTARKGIGEKYEPAFNQPLKDGAEFTIIDRSGDWIFGHFEGIGDGWLRRDAVVE